MPITVAATARVGRRGKRKRGDGEDAWTVYNGVEDFSGRRDILRVRVAPHVTKIGAGAFKWCTNLVEVDLRNVTEIGKDAFSYCRNLTNMELMEGLQSIGNSAFKNCCSLEHVAIPSTVTKVWSDVFSYCSGLKTAKLCDGLQMIGGGVFLRCKSLETISIPSTVTQLGAYAFGSCISLTSVKLAEGLQSIGDSAFRFCSLLKTIKIPATVTTIGAWAFSHCSSLTSVKLAEEGLRSIGKLAFDGCSSLESINIPPTVTEVGLGAFCECKSLFFENEGIADNDPQEIAVDGGDSEGEIPVKDFSASKQDSSVVVEEKEGGILTSPNSGQKNKKEQRAETKKRNAQATIARLEEEKKARRPTTAGDKPNSVRELSVDSEAGLRSVEEGSSPEEDFSKWSRDRLRAKSRELNLPQGNRKQDLIDTLANHFSSADKPRSSPGVTGVEGVTAEAGGATNPAERTTRQQPKLGFHSTVASRLSNLPVALTDGSKPKPRKTRHMCGECEACDRDDCGKCKNCLDKPKFGGKHTLKQKCLERKCLKRNPTGETGQAKAVRDGIAAQPNTGSAALGDDSPESIAGTTPQAPDDEFSESSDDVPLFAWDASQTETLSGGRPKRKLKAIARFESMTFDKKAAHTKIGEGFSCPGCTATCSYDAKKCSHCQLSCYYEAGIGVVVLKERKVDQSRQHLAPQQRNAGSAQLSATAHHDEASIISNDSALLDDGPSPRKKTKIASKQVDSVPGSVEVCNTSTETVVDEPKENGAKSTGGVIADSLVKGSADKEANLADAEREQEGDQMKALESTVPKLATKKLSLLEKVQAQALQLQTVSVKNAKLEGRVAQLSEERESLVVKHSSTEAKMNELRDGKLDVEQKLTKSEQRLAGLRQEVDKAKASHEEEMKSTVAKLTREKQTQVERLEAQYLQLNTAQEKNVSLAGVVAQLKEEKQQFVAKSDFVAQKQATELSKLCKDLAECEGKLECLQRELNQWKASHAEDGSKIGALEEEKAQLEREKQSLATNVEEAAQAKQAAEAKLAQSKQKVATLQEENSKLRTESSDAKRSLDDLRLEVDRLKASHGEEIKILEGTAATLTSEKQSEEDKVKAQALQLKTVLEERESLEGRVAQLTAESDSLARDNAAELSKLRDEKLDIEGRLKESEESRYDVQCEMDRLKGSHAKESARMNNESADQARHIKTLEEDKAQLAKEKETLATNVEEAVQAKQAAEAKLAQSSQNVAALQEEKSKLRAESSDAKRSLGDLRLEVNELKQSHHEEMKILQSSVERLTSEKQREEDKVKAQALQLKTVLEERESLEGRVAQLRGENQRLVHVQETEMSKLRDAKRDLAKDEERTNQLAADVKRFAQAKQTAEAEVAKSKQNVATLQKEMSELRDEKLDTEGRLAESEESRHGLQCEMGQLKASHAKESDRMNEENADQTRQIEALEEEKAQLAKEKLSLGANVDEAAQSKQAAQAELAQSKKNVAALKEETLRLNNLLVALQAGGDTAPNTGNAFDSSTDREPSASSTAREEQDDKAAVLKTFEAKMDAKTPQVKWSDIIGNADAKETLRALKLFGSAEQSWLYGDQKDKKPTGILLYGPPGVGKTLFAQAMATELSGGYICASAKNILGKYVGEPEKKLGCLFEFARTKATAANRPFVIFLDEVDGLLAEPSEFDSDVNAKVIKEFQDNMQGIEGGNGEILVVAATNYPELLPGSILSRFGKRLHIKLPDHKQRKRIIQHCIKKKGTQHSLSPDDIHNLVRFTENASGRDIDTLVENATDERKILAMKCKWWRKDGEVFVPCDKEDRGAKKMGIKAVGGKWEVATFRMVSFRDRNGKVWRISREPRRYRKALSL